MQLLHWAVSSDEIFTWEWLLNISWKPPCKASLWTIKPSLSQTGNKRENGSEHQYSFFFKKKHILFIEYDNYTPRSTILTLSKCQVQHPDHHGAGILTPKILTISRSSWQTPHHALYGTSYPVVGREPVAAVSQSRDSIVQWPIFCFCPDWPKDLAVGLLARGWSGGCPTGSLEQHILNQWAPVAPNRQAHHLIPPLPRLFCI